MNMGVISLIALVVAIVIGFVKKTNVGIISIALAFVIGKLYGVSAGKIISGFSGSLAMSMIGVTYLFGVINCNGTLQKFAGRLVHVAGSRRFMIYIMVFLTGGFLSGVGPGAIPTLSIVPILALPVALSSGINPILLCLIGQMGIQAFRMSPLTPEAVVVQELMNEQGIAGTTVPVMFCMIVTDIFMAIGAYIMFKGWQKIEITAAEEKLENEPFTMVNWLSFIGLCFMIVTVAFFNWNVGLTSFLVGTVLVALDCAKEREVVRSIPWDTIMLVLGVGILMNIVSLSGGLDIMAKSLSSVMSHRTASAIMAGFASFMSFFSSGLGVVFPTLVPMSGAIAQQTGIGALEMVAAVVTGGTITGLSPVSSAGALVLAAVQQNSVTENRYSLNTLFVQLFAVAFMAMVISVVLAFTGVYGLICG